MANALSPDNPHTAIIRDYVAFKLRCNGIYIPRYDQEPTRISEVCKTLRRVCGELEGINRDLFSGMCEQLSITPNTAYPTFQGIADELFETKTNWGRVVAFICFGAELAVHCAIREELGPRFVDNVVNWISRYMESKLDSWLTAHNSWDGFVEFFKKKDEDYFKHGFFISTLAGLGLGALLMLTCK